MSLSGTTLNSGSGGDTLARYTDGTRIFPAGITAYVSATGSPDTITPVDATHGLPVVSQTGASWAVTDNSGSLTVDAPVGTPVFVRLSDGTSAITTLPVSVASLPLPSGAATAAKQPALGTAGAASADVLTVQGVASMTALKVDGSAVTQPVSDGGGSLTVDGTVAVSGTVTVGTHAVTQASGPWSQNVTQWAGTAVDVNSGNKSAGTLRVVLATDQPSPSNAFPVSQSGTWTVQPGNTANTTPWLVTDTPATSGGLSFAHVTSAASNNKTQVKGSAGQLYSIIAVNLSASVRYLKVFNNTSAGVTMGTTAADWQVPIPSNSTNGGGVAVNIDKGLAHGTGITIAITGGVSLTDNTAISANDVCLTVGFK